MVVNVVTLDMAREDQRRIGPKRLKLCPLSLTKGMRDASGRDSF